MRTPVLLITIFLCFVIEVISLSPYTENTTSNCVCLLEEDQDNCNNPSKPQRLCSNKLTPFDCQSIKLQGRSVCVWRNRDNQNLLAAHGKKFETPQLIEVVPGMVHLAVGFGLANSVILEGDDGVVIVDTLESIQAAQDLKAAIKFLTDLKPVKAVIYLHSHSDHVQGASVFAPMGSGIPIYGHQDLVNEIVQVSLIAPAIFQRSMRQFGVYLEEGPDGFLNAGIGPILRFGSNFTSGYIAPTHTVDNELSLNISGIEFDLLYSPGETSDQLNLHIPSIDLVIAADNYYQAFPNIYAIRGTKPREARFWYQSIDRILDLEPEYLVGTHILPIIGKSTIQETLLSYRDGIQYIYDKTRFWMNQGVNLEDITSYVKLPPYLASHPSLIEYYGLVDFHVRSIFVGEIGWFGGSSVDLQPLNPLARAQRIVALGKMSRTIWSAKSALAENTQEGDQWALELSHAILLVQPNHPSALDIKIKALENLAIRTLSSNARNYYLSEANKLKGNLETPFSIVNQANGIIQNPINFLLENFAMRLNANKTDNVMFNVLFKFTDTSHYTFRIRRHVAEVRSWPQNQTPSWTFNLNITSTSMNFKLIILDPSKIAQFLMQGSLILNPSPPTGSGLLITFLNYFN